MKSTKTILMKVVALIVVGIIMFSMVVINAETYTAAEKKKILDKLKADNVDSSVNTGYIGEDKQYIYYNDYKKNCVMKIDKGTNIESPASMNGMGLTIGVGADGKTQILTIQTFKANKPGSYRRALITMDKYYSTTSTIMEVSTGDMEYRGYNKTDGLLGYCNTSTKSSGLNKVTFNSKTGKFSSIPLIKGASNFELVGNDLYYVDSTTGIKNSPKINGQLKKIAGFLPTCKVKAAQAVVKYNVYNLQVEGGVVYYQKVSDGALYSIKSPAKKIWQNNKQDIFVTDKYAISSDIKATSTGMKGTNSYIDLTTKKVTSYPMDRYTQQGVIHAFDGDQVRVILYDGTKIYETMLESSLYYTFMISPEAAKCESGG